MFMPLAIDEILLSGEFCVIVYPKLMRREFYMSNQATLIYVHDPMCSWCWGFRPTLEALVLSLPNKIHYKRLVGGLAADSNEIMPKVMQQSIMGIWQQIQIKIPGTYFNYVFWEKNLPRRSTYPACRAVIAAKTSNKDFDEAMTLAIQQAYYQEALNPSDESVLVQLAENLGIAAPEFKQKLHSKEVEEEFRQQLNFSREIGANSFPSLILEVGKNNFHPINIDYLNADNMLITINALLENSTRTTF